MIACDGIVLTPSEYYHDVVGSRSAVAEHEAVQFATKQTKALSNSLKVVASRLALLEDKLLIARYRFDAEPDNVELEMMYDEACDEVVSMKDEQIQMMDKFNTAFNEARVEYLASEGMLLLS